MALSESIAGAVKADISINFGVGELRINPLREGDNLFEGSFLLETDKLVNWRGIW
ncbi:MAG: hypothetical protein IBX64_06170 [Actinobacteria bacterium]|nr:hypothetical protein [Actinomycetota bacterium]